jgi:chromosome segregation ATPase
VETQPVKANAEGATSSGTKAVRAKSNWFDRKFETIHEQMILLHSEIVSIQLSVSANTDEFEVLKMQIADLEKARQSQEAKTESLISNVDLMSSHLKSLTNSVRELTFTLNALLAPNTLRE